MANSRQSRFIVKSKIKHEGKYTYNKVNYVDNLTKVTITCPEHGDFEQTPNSHVRGFGCSGCSGTKKLTTEEFIKRSNKKHNNKFGYSKTVYKSAHAKVTITCPEHGDFEQEANSHLKGFGCIDCGGRKPLDTKNFINKAVEVHGKTYTYRKVNYKDTDTKIIITCLVHGDFKQTPHSHLQGRGCAKCAGTEILGTEKFIEKAKEIHKDKYDYSKVNYKSSFDKIEIICKLHGIFKQTPNSHTMGQGCAKCAGTYKYNTAEFIEKALKIHNGYYTYNNTTYINTNTDIIITCPIHGDFKQTPKIHIKGHGCSDCNLFNGWTKKNFEDFCEKAKLYLIKCYKDSEVFYKIGITTRNVKSRFNGCMPYNIEEIALIEGKSGYIYDLEKSLHRKLKKFRYEPLINFDGRTECFLLTKTQLDEIINIIEYREKEDAS